VPAVAMFYHLMRAGLDDTVTMIVTRAMGQGWRVMLRGTDLGLLGRLDDKLWLGPEDSFLPHGLEGGPQDANQPVLLGLGPIANAAQGLVLLAGAEVQRDEVATLERVWLLFDGADEAAVQAAREQWTRLTGWGMAAQYWSDDSGSWVKKVEKAAVLPADNG
jgi:DNA polymerase III subunit chi